MQNGHHETVIIGGGTGGLVVASLLMRAGEDDVLIIEPSAQHFYQPIWTLVGSGVVPKEVSVREEADFIPRGAQWLQDAVVELDPHRNSITTKHSSRITYDFLVVAAGIQLNWDAIPGMSEALRTDCVSSNYGYELAPKTWRIISGFKGGVALFHMPGTPIKCPGAPQKIMYLAADHFRRTGVNDAKVIYGSAPGSIYGIPEYAAVLNRVIERYGIDARFGSELVEIRPDKREAVFASKGDSSGRREAIQYDMLHVAPFQSAPDFVKNSPLADQQKPAEGWIKVDKGTLQNPDFPNVFALGDVAGTPNSKTGASACRQAPVVASNLLSVIRGVEPANRYNGYVACPIVTAYGRMLLCEFDYSGRPSPTIPFINTFKERYDMWLLKRYGLPWLYWNVILRGSNIPFLRGQHSLNIPQAVGAHA